jgi:uncharacterized lipoprotein YbaY
MKRMLLAISAAAIASVFACATSSATPIAPIPAATVITDNVVQAHYYHHHFYPYRYHGHHRYYAH